MSNEAQTNAFSQFPPNQFLDNGILYSSTRQWLEAQTTGGRRDGIFSKEVWECTNFAEMFALMAREQVKAARKRYIKQAKGRHNIILNGDSYKASHFLQYPPGTTEVYSYIESRGGLYDVAVYAGFQMFAKEYLTVRVTQEMIEEAAEVYEKHRVPFNRAGWQYIVDKLGGKLPISIHSAPEGSVITVKNVLLTIVNTDPNCFWLTSFLETALLRAIWFPTTVASKSFAAKKVIKRFLDLTSDIPEVLLPSRLHDFGARGTSSEESAAIGGIAHMINFEGTDTLSAIRAARKYYSAIMPGFSIPAAEHSTITSWGKEAEVDAYRNMLRQFARPGSYVAVVSDSYDLFNAVDNIWGTELRQHVIDSGATVIIRPDSGNVYTIPVETVERLAEKFGYTINSKGYKVLNHVRVIQGDGIDDEKVIEKILQNLTDAGFATDNIAFGMGGGLLQKVNRDDMKFAMKCSAIKINGEWREVFKDPKTDPGKRSKRGKLALVHEGGWETLPLDGNHWRNSLVETFRNGDLKREYTFDEVREPSVKYLARNLPLAA
jgi:nicotinamide phosphoribosyltransferase